MAVVTGCQLPFSRAFLVVLFFYFILWGGGGGGES
jgi:hypothetical protein